MSWRLYEIPGRRYLAEYIFELNIGTARCWLASLRKTEAELGEKLEEKQRNRDASRSPQGSAPNPT